MTPNTAEVTLTPVLRRRWLLKAIPVVWHLPNWVAVPVIAWVIEQLYIEIQTENGSIISTIKPAFKTRLEDNSIVVEKIPTEDEL